MSMFNDISWGSKDNEKECKSNALNSFLSLRREPEQDNGHSSGLIQKRSGTLSVKTVHKASGTKWQKR